MTMFRLSLAALALGSALSAQITTFNDALVPPSRFVTTTGSAHSIDKTNFILGSASCARSAATASSSYLTTGIRLDPESKSIFCNTGDKGWTIQWWYRPAAPTTFEYLWGDRDWTGASGAFRCFQNGAAGSGNLYLRGPLGQRLTTGSPLTTAVNAKGWVHFAVVQNNANSTCTWYVNGAVNSSGASTGTGVGRNFTCMGYNGSSSAGATGNFDDFRVYNYARSAADIAGDFQKEAAGAGPSQCPNQPDEGYFKCELNVNPHLGTIALLNEPPGDVTRLFTGGDTVDFQIDSPATGPFTAVGVVNFFPASPNNDPRRAAYGQPAPLPGGPFRSFLPGLALGGPWSTPAYPLAVILPGQVTYGNNVPGRFRIPVPGNVNMASGDRVVFQWVMGDATYNHPTGLGTTNVTDFQFIKPTKPQGVHVEAAGQNPLQDTGFFEVWNTGSVPIKEVQIDLSTLATPQTWNATGLLNSGGTLASGSSFRFDTDTICDLTPVANPRYTLTNANATLTFTFGCPPTANAGGFQGPTNHFIFDCRTSRDVSGSQFAGATVKVTFCNNLSVTGKLTAVPNTDRAEIDL